MTNKLPAGIIVLLAIAFSASAQVGIGTTSPNSTLDVRGSLSANYRAFTSSTSAATDNTLVFTGSSAATLTLPDASTCTGRIYYVKNASATSPTPVLTMATVSSQTIDGLSSWTLDEPNEVVRVVSNGANWWVAVQDVPVGKTSTTGGPWNQGGNSVTAAKALGTITNYDLPFVTNNTEKMRISAAGNVAIGATSFNVTNPEKLLVNAGVTSSVNAIVGKGTSTTYLQLNIQNLSNGTGASSDVVATSDNGNESVNYVDMGINSSANTSSGVLGGINNAYLYSTGNDFIIGNATTNKNLILFSSTGTPTERMRVTAAGNVGIGTTTPNSTFEVNGAVAYPITTTTTNLTLGASNYTVIITGGTPTITLPAASASNARRVYVIVNESNSDCTISTYKDFTSANNTTVFSWTSITVQSNGSNWYQIH